MRFIAYKNWEVGESFHYLLVCNITEKIKAFNNIMTIIMVLRKKISVQSVVANYFGFDL